MAKIAIFTERTTLRMSAQLEAFFNFRLCAREMGHTLDFMFKHDIKYIRNYDAIFIRALTDPLNSSYYISRFAEINNIKVLDKSSDIRICADKVNMYSHLEKAKVPYPNTYLLYEYELTKENAYDFFETVGMPIVLKAPNSSFSAYVDKASTVDDFLKIGKKFFRRSDIIVLQQYLPSKFDWRVIILDNKILSIVKYIMDPHAWKILDKDPEGRTLDSTVEGYDIDKVNPKLIETALMAGKAIGNGLYGIDIKEIDGDFVVIEVNDNPNIDDGLEDQKSPKIYEWIIKYLVGEDFEGL